MKIAVYCSSRGDLPQEVVDFATMAGNWIGRNGHTLVYGGVKAGLMHVTAEAVKAAGGRVVGVIPELFKHRADPLCDELLLARDLNDRKSQMIALSDAFIVLPGGLGTVDEWISTLSQFTVDRTFTKPIIVCNHDNMFHSLAEQLAQIGQSVYGFGRQMPTTEYVQSVEELKEKLDKLITK